MDMKKISGLLIFLVLIGFIMMAGCTYAPSFPGPATPTSSKTHISPTMISVTATIIPPNHKTGATSRTFNYILRGKQGSIPIILYAGVYNDQKAQSPLYICSRHYGDSSPCTSEENLQYYLKYMNEPAQKSDLDELVRQIKSQTAVEDDQARIAISLVQKIPYDYNKYYASSKTNETRYPYQVLYNNTGNCGEKSLLLAYLLRELGYGVALFKFSSENHMAVGIKTPNQYSYKNLGYAFIESTTPTIPTDSQGDYLGAGKLTSSPQVFQISDGYSFSSLSEEYQDSIAFNQFGKGTTLSPEKYRQWEILMWKYGLTTSNGTTFPENPSNKPLCDNEGILCNSECYEKCGPFMIGKCTPNGVICEGFWDFLNSFFSFF